MRKKPNAGKLLSVTLALALAAGGCGTTTQNEPPGSTAGEAMTDTADNEVKNECPDGDESGGWTVGTEATENSDYKLVWEDEFEGDRLNMDDWNFEYHEPGWVNAELQEYVDSEKNTYVKDGKLYIQALKEIIDGKPYYTSGRINTQGKHDFQYGRFEARAKVPSGKGFLPAFWMMPTEEGYYGQW